MTTRTHITTSGGLISAAFIENVREPGSRQRGVEPASFALPWAEAPKSPAALEETIATAWELLLERWDAVRADLPMMDVSQVRSRWLLPLFQLLDFDPVYLRGDTVLDEEGKLRYSLSHRGWPALSPALSEVEGEVEGEGEDALHPEPVEGPVIHTVIPSQNLDARVAAGRGASTGSARRIKAKSPHDMLQAFLNVSPVDLWAVLTNGILLRLLRDYHHTFTKGFVQFDLESIFETRNYGDFRALYRLCHASRFVSQGEGDEAILPLEQFYKDSIATGIKVGEDLRGQVRQAIETLGNGFLDGDLIHRLQADPSPPQAGGTEGGQALCRDYYGEILHIIYRILFLLFAEQRGMMPGRDSLYAEAYSIAQLRARAEGDIPREDDFTDLWEGLKVTFRMVREGVPDLGVFGYDGMLFDDDQIPLLNGSPPPSQGGGSGRGVRNSDLLRAIRALTLIEREGVLQRISYADLGVEELGSIYESLLDFTPRVTTGPEKIDASTSLSTGASASLSTGGREIPANTFFLDPRGSERKTTGSYYTHPSLVNELIKSALLPVTRDRLVAAGLPVIEEDAIGEATAGLLTDYAGLTDEQRAAGEAALLSIKVCDPAAGSGHFLVKANNALGAELARIRTGDEYPTETQVQAAKRDVLAHCIYAVDVNPMAVELCKVSLWINASVADRPLSFLDHHIKYGNSLIGATPKLMAEGIPYQAFDPKIVGNDRATANGIRKRNREEQAGQLPLGWRVMVIETHEDLERWRQFSQLSKEQPRVAREQYAEYITAAEHQRRKLAADFWAAAFFWPLPKGVEWVPTHGEFMRLRAEGLEVLPPAALAQVEARAEQYRFFHWHLEFPDVFADDGAGGFDVVLGNPPWERIKLQEKEFFADKDPEIANARTAAERRKLIRKLPQANPSLHAAYTASLRDSETTGHFLQASGRFPLSSVGDINTYAVFIGLARHIIVTTGRAGIVVPTGIATDYTYREFFADVVESGQLASLYDFENRAGLFPGTHRSYKFALLTLAGGGVPEAEFAFFLHTTGDLTDPERRFTLGPSNLALMNPNTRTMPVFRTRQDAELTHKLYYSCPVLYDAARERNPWGVSLGTMFHSGSASGLFCSYEDLADRGLELTSANRFEGDSGVYLPLYEGKMFMQYDHRAAAVIVDPKNIKRPAMALESSLGQKQDPGYSPMPRFWVLADEVGTAIPQLSGDYLVTFKKVTSPTNERTLLATVLPFVAATDSIHIVFFQSDIAPSKVTTFLGNLNSMVLDFVARQKLGGVNFNFYVLEQLPVLPSDRYTPELLDFIVPRVVELTYTAWDLQPFAQDILDEVGPDTWARWFADAPVHTSLPPEGQPATPAPFVWDEDRRAHLRAELDALYAHLYGLTREELDYILDAFPIVRRKDEERRGEYWTKRMVMEKHEELDGMGLLKQ